MIALIVPKHIITSREFCHRHHQPSLGVTHTNKLKQDKQNSIVLSLSSTIKARRRLNLFCRYIMLMMIIILYAKTRGKHIDDWPNRSGSALLDHEAWPQYVRTTFSCFNSCMTVCHRLFCRIIVHTVSRYDISIERMSKCVCVGVHLHGPTATTQNKRYEKIHKLGTKQQQK